MRKRKPSQPHTAIRRMIQKLKLLPNNVLLIKRDSKLAQPDMLEAMGKMFEEHYNFHIVFIVVDDFNEISIADEKTMLEFGWINVDTATDEMLLENKLVRWPRGVGKDVKRITSPATAE